ncbi:MAG: hypothetical protein HHJ14_14715 [Cellulomonas sp.]|nr:hypothetical protein [Cellulomonas sp.]
MAGLTPVQSAALALGVDDDPTDAVDGPEHAARASAPAPAVERAEEGPAVEGQVRQGT